MANMQGRGNPILSSPIITVVSIVMSNNYGKSAQGRDMTISNCLHRLRKDSGVFRSGGGGVGLGHGPLCQFFSQLEKLENLGCHPLV